MDKQHSNKLIPILVIIIIILTSFIFFRKNNVSPVTSGITASTTNVAQIIDSTNVVNSNSEKTFVFDNFHGSNDISLKFQFTYPANFYNEGQYFSPEQIAHYDLYSVTAPFYYDLILANVFDQTEFKNQIDSSKRNSPDRHGLIGGKDFKRYDLIDYGSYGGESAGRVIIYVGPTIKINGLNYYLVFHWEEKPLTTVVLGNDPNIFEKIVHSLKFI